LFRNVNGVTKIDLYNISYFNIGRIWPI
jgi:hypothetical protein